MKCIKRKEDDTDLEKFYVPCGQWKAADAAVDCALGIQQPAAPQKSERPATPPSTILSLSPASEDISLSKSMYQTVIVKNNYTSIIILSLRIEIIE